MKERLLTILKILSIPLGLMAVSLIYVALWKIFKLSSQDQLVAAVR